MLPDPTTRTIRRETSEDDLDLTGLPIGEYAFSGPLRDRLVGAILSGAKTATSSLAEAWRRAGDPMPRVGDLEVVVDSAARLVCVTRNTAVATCRLAEVTDEHAEREGEGFAHAAAWRAAHEAFWGSPELVAELGDPPVPMDDDTQVVCVTFEVIRQLRSY